MMFRINRKGNRKLFVETDKFNDALKMTFEEEKRGYKMEIRQLKGSRWYLIYTTDKPE